MTQERLGDVNGRLTLYPFRAELNRLLLPIGSFTQTLSLFCGRVWVGLTSLNNLNLSEVLIMNINRPRKKTYQGSLKKKQKNYWKLIKFARSMQDNPTNAERDFKIRLEQWNKLKFKTQEILGFYIVDFCFPEKMTVIELDGSVHYKQEEYDSDRDAFLKACYSLHLK